MRRLRIAVLMVAVLALPGCASVAMTVASIAGGATVDHTMGGIVDKTFTSALANLRYATLVALNRMGIEVTEDREDDAGWTIVAAANDREIDIELEQVTPRTTRMRVVVNKGDFLIRDRATGTEIVIQTSTTLHEKSRRAPAAR